MKNRQHNVPTQTHTDTSTQLQLTKLICIENNVVKWTWMEFRFSMIYNFDAIGSE